MRIVCQKCSAAYAIDDKLVTPKGVRAQCPRCRNLQLVKSGDAQPAAVAAPPAPARASPAPASSSGNAFLFDLDSQPGGASARPAVAAPAEAPMPDFGAFDAPAAPVPAADDGDPELLDFSDFSEFQARPSHPSAPPAPASKASSTLPPAPRAEGSSGRPAGGDFLDFSDLNSGQFELPAEPAPAPARPNPSSPRAPTSAPRPPSSAPRAATAPARPPTSAPRPSASSGLRATSSAPASDDPFSSLAQPAGPSSPGSSDFGPRGQLLNVSTPGIASPLSAPAPVDFQFEAPPPPGAAVTCKTCGKVLTDPFDQALGVCDDCRNGENSQPVPLADAPPASTPVGFLKPIKVPASQVAGAAPALSIELADEPKTDVELKAARPARAVVSARRDGDEPEGGRGKTVALAVLSVLVLGGGGAYLAIKRPWVHRAPPLAQRLPVGTARPIEAMVERWKQKYPDLTGSAAEFQRAGEEKLAQDTSQGYADAEELFQKALVLDKSLDQAVAGWALALAFGRAGQIDDELMKVAEQMLIAAGQRGGDNRVFIAHAHLMVARGGNFNDVKALADRGLSSPSDKDKALANLALGELYLGKSPQYAAEHFKKALELDPKLKRGYLYQARLSISQGELQSAAASLNKRLELDPDQWEAADALARLHLEVGELASAKKDYQRAAAAAPTSARPKLALAVFAYQHEGDLVGALAQFDELLKAKARLDPQELVELLGHRAAAARYAGDLEGAANSAQQAIDLKADDAHAHLQKFLVALEQGKSAEARPHLPSVKLFDVALEQTLEGRLLLAEGKNIEAMAMLQKAIETDPRRTDALLLAGAAAAKNKNEVKAWDYVLKRGLKTDPNQSGVLPVMARFAVRPADVLKGAKGAFAGLSKDAEDPNPATADGLVAWHSGDWAGAEAAFTRVTTFDPANGPGFAFRALLSLKKKDLPSATRWATRAVECDKKLGLAQYALGMVQAATNKTELARKSLRAALDSSPGLLAARVKLAEADLKLNKVSDARSALATVLLADPNYLQARRVLFQVPPQ